MNFQEFIFYSHMFGGFIILTNFVKLFIFASLFTFSVWAYFSSKPLTRLIVRLLTSELSCRRSHVKAPLLCCHQRVFSNLSSTSCYIKGAIKSKVKVQVVGSVRENDDELRLIIFMTTKSVTGIFQQSLSRNCHQSL